MKNIFYSFVSAISLTAYIVLISFVLSNGEYWFGKIGGFWPPVIMISLLVFSVLVSGTLSFGRPVWLFLEGHKKSAIYSFFLTALWMLIILISIFLIAIITS